MRWLSHKPGGFLGLLAFYVTAALRVTLRDMTETYVAVAWDRAVPDDHASRTFQNVFAELVL